MDFLLVLPILIPLVSAALALFARNRVAVQRTSCVVATAALLVVTGLLLARVWTHGVQATHIGNWPAPFGIALVADLFSAMMLLVTAIVGCAVAVYSLANIDERRESYGYYPLYQILLMGICGSFLTGDLFNLYVWFEVMLVSSFVLLVLGGESAQVIGGIKYVMLNLLSSLVFLSAVGILYGVAGTLNMADLSQKLADTEHPGTVTVLAMLFLVAFGIKSAIFPLFFWLPASYHTPPVAVSAVFAGLLTKVGVYALIRVFTLLFVHDVQFTHTLILILSGLTMLTGVLGAASQNEFRRILSFHIISQIGYMTMGLGLAGLASTPTAAIAALAGSVFYIAHHIMVKTNLFLVSGVTHYLQGSFQLHRLGGMYRSYPLLSVLFLVPAFSLAGVPPLSGFFAKLALVQAGLQIEQYLIVGVSLLVGLLTLYSMTKIWHEVFWKQPLTGAELPAARVSTGKFPLLVLPVAMLGAITTGIGLGAGPVFQLATEVAEQLIDSEQYVRAVVESAR